MEIKDIVEKFLQKLRFRQVIPYIKNPNVLDFGCGDMAIKKFIKGNYVGTENDNFPRIKYDTILMLAVIEHLKNPRKKIKLLKKYLKDDGIIIATLPTPKGEKIVKLLARFRLCYTEGRQKHIGCYNKEQALSLFEGLKTEHRYFEFGFNQMIIAKKKS